MEFQETGLLNHKQVYNAYALFNSYEEEMPEDVRKVVMNAATLLSQSGCKDEKPIVYALISFLPLDPPFIEQRFGGWMIEMAEEIQILHRNEYKDVAAAPEHIKLFSLAAQIAGYDLLARAGAHVPKAAMKNLIDGVRGKTTCPALEKRYEDAFGRFWRVRKTERPAFEDLMFLPDTGSVRNAYRFITEDKNVPDAAFEKAIRIAHILTGFSEGAPDTDLIAAALIAGAEAASVKDVVALNGLIGEEAMKILIYGILDDPNDPAKSVCPSNVAKLAMADAHLKVSIILQELQDALHTRQDNPSAFEKGFGDKIASWHAAAQAVLKHVSEGGSDSLAQKAQMPRMAQRLRENVEILRRASARNLHKKPAGKPPHPGM